MSVNATRAWLIIARNYLRVPLGNLAGIAFTRAVLREDVRVCRNAVHRTSLAAPRLPSVPADEPSLELLRLLRRWKEREGRCAAEDGSPARAEA